jgi:hypothetical protein
VAITVSWYGLGMQHILKQDTNSDLEVADLFLGLVTASYTPNVDTDEFWSTPVANELASGNGYTTNGFDVTGATYSYDSASDQIRLDIGDPTWTFTAGKTWRYGVLYERTSGTDASRKLFALLNWGTDQTVSTAYTLVIDPTGLLFVDTT